ncbi:hypothetical protein [Laspinema olomoucense]|uniref:Uncharacterized protein n=1 Tax=Laspinema olomoucense D3b TaxID=2953688 RepID=A0ABT2N669_9CYAN|nr:MULTISPECIES: hypothetical protein [unclassified Laspinema]MCT7972990.1 hypothetical protein [Laspinema sp. D3d]MCT7977971.1 hypothetical protein [Laspinema sp. D3b]MCT7987038.1 hypothetical protein [Laspinema sp. D3a]MCT7994255.1 hypothetical protein [Laspinema sp. D3c]
MNEERIEASRNLIQQLLTCPSGEGPQILKQQFELVDEEFVRLCEQEAQKLQQVGKENQAVLLRNVAQTVGEYLNRQRSGGGGKFLPTIGDLRVDATLIDDVNYREASESLPASWSKIQPVFVYKTLNEMLVSFGQKQIQEGIRYDATNKHLKAIEKGRVAPRGNMGLVPSEEEGYDLKSKVLGKGGDRRFHGKFIDGVLHFPGYATEH